MIRRGIAAARATGSETMLAAHVQHGGEALVTLGHDHRGAVLLAAATIGPFSPRVMGGRELEQRQRAQERARERLGAERYAAAAAEGAAMGTEDAAAYALAAADALDGDGMPNEPAGAVGSRAGNTLRGPG
jgi:hypothetical protein